LLRRYARDERNLRQALEQMQALLKSIAINFRNARKVKFAEDTANIERISEELKRSSSVDTAGDEQVRIVQV